MMPFHWTSIVLDCLLTNVYLYTFVRSDMNSREVIAALQADSWFEVARKGSHIQFKHPSKPGRTTVPHPERDIPIGTLRSIERQSGLRLRRS
jgi:predicted RNA binding protein YcfA (HicA-like mRNA interferase family)